MAENEQVVARVVVLPGSGLDSGAEFKTGLAVASTQVFSSQNDFFASSEDEANFRTELWRLLAKQVVLYTMGESTSLPEYDAHRLLASVCYVLGVDPDMPDAALVRSIVHEGVEAAFDRRLACIEQKTRQAESLWSEVCLSMPLLESVALKDTLESLRNFKVRYEPRFFAHEIPADIDYPLCAPVSESLGGVDYVTTYLERLLLECRFLRHFDVDDCRHLLHAVYPQYAELILNLFEPVVANALGCALAGCDVRALKIDARARSRIGEKLNGCTKRSIEQALAAAAVRACDSLAIDDAASRAYVERAARKLAPRVAIATPSTVWL